MKLLVTNQTDEPIEIGIPPTLCLVLGEDATVVDAREFLERMQMGLPPGVSLEAVE